ncbi:hypothetical protein Q3G72_007566 [Acer saccharum]|nr:hypothetical protein Q3G72_007566 [Acer saccharum]
MKCKDSKQSLTQMTQIDRTVASAEDPELVKRIGAATALEVRATGIPYVFAPCIAVCRDPRWGRCYESYSEDHKIVQEMTEIVPGLQGDLPAGSRKGMEPTKLVITYGGKWVGNFYEGGETELKKVNRNLTYAELSRLVQGVANIDLTRFTIDLRTLVDTGVRLRPARPKIKDDSDVEILLCDDGHVPEVYVSVVEKVL